MKNKKFSKNETFSDDLRILNRYHFIDIKQNDMM